MNHFELFVDYVCNKKDIRQYVVERKKFKTRGEFTDATLIRSQEYLERMEKESPEIYQKMYETLDKYFAQDTGHRIEYPINFIYEVLKIYDKNIPAEKICKKYIAGLDHKCLDS